MVKSCYIHIPFCQSICSYCDFCKVFYQEDIASSYLDCLEKEIKEKYKGEVLDTLYFGGGTQSSLSPSLLEKLFSLCSIFHLSPTCEITMEGNVESLTEEKIQIMKDFGVNRISLGLETTIPSLQKTLERPFSKKIFQKAISLLRSYGISDINVDLMYALPGESLEDLKKDLDFLCSLPITHISTYSLILEEHTKLKIQNIMPMGEELDLAMYHFIEKRLKKEGYCHYEISNFCKPSFASRHNLAYWKNQEYYGFGLGAASYLFPYRRSNTRSLTKYLKGEFSFEEEKLGKKEVMDYEVLLGLRLIEGINKDSFFQKYGLDLSLVYDYSILVRQVVLEENNSFVRLNPKYYYVLNEVIVEFLQRRKCE